MTCKSEGTHHHACECREEYVKKLERVVEAADHFLNGMYLEEPDKRMNKLVESLKAMRGKEIK